VFRCLVDTLIWTLYANCLVYVTGNDILIDCLVYVNMLRCDKLVLKTFETCLPSHSATSFHVKFILQLR